MAMYSKAWVGVLAMVFVVLGSLGCGTGLIVEESKPAKIDQDKEAARLALQRWKQRFEQNPDWLEGSALTASIDTANEYHEWMADYLDALAWEDFPIAIKFMEELNERHEFDVAFTSEPRERMIRFALKAGQHQLSDSLTLIRFGQMENVWADAANAALENRDEALFDVALAKLNEQPGEPIQLFSVGPDPGLFAAAAKLEWLRAEEKQSAIEIELAIESLNDNLAAKKASSSEVGVSFTVFTASRQYIELESYRITSQTENPDSIKHRFQPLAETVARFDWPEIVLPELTSAAVQPWIDRQLHCQRLEVVLAYLARAKGSDLLRSAMLSEVARHAFEIEPQLSSDCLSLAEQLLESTRTNQSEEEAEADWESLLRMEAEAERSVTLARIGRGEEAVEVARSLVRQWEARAEASETDTRFQGRANRDAYYSVLQAISATGLRAEDLSDRLIDQIDESIGQIRGSFSIEGGVTSAKCPIWVRNQIRWVDMSAIVTVPKQRIAEPYIPEFYSHVDKQEWLLAAEQFKQELANQEHFGTTAIGRHHSLNVLKGISRQSVQQIGLKATLEWTAQVTDESIRWVIECSAIVEALEIDKKRIPKRAAPASIFPIDMTWTGC